MTTTQKRTGKQFWREKLAANKARDRFVTRQLRRNGWTVIRIWEHKLTAVSPQSQTRYQEHSAGVAAGRMLTTDR